MTALLRLEGIAKSYGSVVVADAVDLELAEGEAVGVVGPNGAGKTSLLDLVTGLVRPDSGRVLLDGHDLTGVAVHARCRAGIGRTFQVPRPFGGMTVFENVLVAAVHGGGARPGDAVPACVAALERTGLLERANLVAGTLPLLARKRLELARALATGPRLLLLDEIAGGLTEPEVAELVATILALRAEGLTILWIEHIVHALLSVVDRLVAIDVGRVLADGDPRTVMASPQVQQVYLGAE